jgi:hypothetical protein
MSNHDVRIMRLERKHEVEVDRSPAGSTSELLPHARVGEARLSDVLEAPGLQGHGQDIGQHLWGVLGLPIGLGEGDHLVIKSDDAFVLCLPWQCLHDGAGVLANRGVVIEVGHQRAPRSPHLDAHLRVVLGLPETHEDTDLWHRSLSSGAVSCEIVCARDPAELLSAMGGSDIVVLPSHGVADPSADRRVLQLEIGPLPYDRLTERAREFPPRIVLFGTLGAPPFWLLQRAAELSEHVPCVLVAPEPEEDPQGPPAPNHALKLVRSLYEHGCSPAQACNAPELGWDPLLRPRCFGGSRPPRPQNLPAWLRDDSWRLRLDRRKQARLAAGVMTEVIDTPARRAGSGAVLLWCGRADSGLERLHGRLRWELRQRKQDVVVCTPRWPSCAEYDAAEFAGMYLHVLGAHPQDLEPGRGEALRRHIERHYPPLASGTRQILYVDHKVLPESFAREPGAALVLCDYVAWFREVIAPAVPERLVPVLALALVRPASEVWLKDLQQALVSSRPRHRPLQVELLPELPDVCEEDLLDFLEEHQLEVPESKRQGVVQAILRRTQGRYEATLRELEQLPFTWQAWWNRHQRDQQR